MGNKKRVFSDDQWELGDVVDTVPSEEGYQLLANVVGEEEGSNSALAMLDAFEGDELYAVAVGSSDPGSRDQMNTVLKEIASEAAHLRLLRDVQKSGGANYLKTSEARLKMLKSYAELSILLRKEDAAEGNLGGDVNFHSDGFSNVVKMFIGIVTRSMDESGVSEDKQRTFLNRFAANMSGFEDKARRVYLGEDIDEESEFHGEL